MIDVTTGPISSTETTLEKPAVEVFAVYGVEPEVQAYAMAKYSRSALSMKESLKEISSQKAEKFLNTFYFQYGHRSIADLAHIALAIEKLSILAAIAIADEQRWDGQERSTRYQDFKKSGAFIPGIRPGEQTSRHIDRILSRLTLAGAIYIALVCLLPEFLVLKYNVPFYFGGTSLLIIVVVTMDFWAQVQSYVMSQQYESLLKKANFKAS